MPSKQAEGENMKVFYDIKGVGTGVRAEEMDSAKSKIVADNKGGCKIVVNSEKLRNQEMSIGAVEQTDVDTLLFISRDWNKIAVQFEEGDYDSEFFKMLIYAIENHVCMKTVQYLRFYKDVAGK